MPDLVDGSLIRSTDTPVSQDDRNNETVISAGTGSDSWISVAPEVSVSFVGPTSGRALVVVGGGLRSQSSPANTRVWIAPEVRVDDVDGAIVMDPGDENRFGTTTESSAYQYGTRSTLITGLEPGRTYFARAMTNASASSSIYDLFERSIHVRPVS